MTSSWRRNPFRRFLALAAMLTAYGFEWPWDGRNIPADRELTGGGNFGTLPTNGVPLQARQDAAIDNVGATAHTLTLTLRGSGGSSGATITRGLPAGASAPVSGEGILSFTIDSADASVYYQFGPRGSVYPFRSAPGGGAGTAASIINHDASGSGLTTFTPSANLRFMGLGHAAVLPNPLVFTAKKSGNVTLRINGYCNIQTATLLANYAHLYTGTGAAPAQGAAATGTEYAAYIVYMDTTTAANSVVSFCISVTVAIPLATATWFDLLCGFTTTANAWTIVTADLVEEPA